MADFKRGLDRLLHFEGVFSNNPADKGGTTKWGISKAEFPDLDIENLTRQQMEKIYHDYYWAPLQLDEIHSQGLADEIFEQGVNFGIGVAARNAQRAVNYFRSEKIVVDRTIGPVTVEALNDCVAPASLLLLLNGLQLIKYLEIVDSNPSQDVFIRGWLKRVEFARNID